MSQMLSHPPRRRYHAPRRGSAGRLRAPGAALALPRRNAQGGAPAAGGGAPGGANRAAAAAGEGRRVAGDLGFSTRFLGENCFFFFSPPLSSP